MTPEEIVAEVDAKNRQLLESSGMTVSHGILDLLNQAALNGVQIGSRMACSMMEGALTVQLAAMNKGAGNANKS